MKRLALIVALLMSAGPACAQDEDAAEEGAPVAPAERGPTTLDQTGVDPGAGPTITDQAWDERIRASVAAAQALQGPLDGRWFLVGADNTPIFIFQFVDPAGGRGPLEGVWRDLRRPAGTGSYGMVWSLERYGPQLTLSFFPPGATKPVQVRLEGTAGAWRGRMTENEAATEVVLRR